MTPSVCRARAMVMPSEDFGLIQGGVDEEEELVTR